MWPLSFKAQFCFCFVCVCVCVCACVCVRESCNWCFWFIKKIYEAWSYCGGLIYCLGLQCSQTHQFETEWVINTSAKMLAIPVIAFLFFFFFHFSALFCRGGFIPNKRYHSCRTVTFNVSYRLFINKLDMQPIPNLNSDKLMKKCKLHIAQQRQ